MFGVTFVQPDGSRRTVQVKPGQTLMRAAIEANVEGIQADCGGCLSCATCHVYLDGATGIEAPSEDECGMLEAVAADREPVSRLSCQVVGGPALADAVVRVPQRQA